ncbi:MAG: hypothetical protein V4527_14910 [Pseudomonadota bacterium]
MPSLSIDFTAEIDGAGYDLRIADLPIGSRRPTGSKKTLAIVGRGGPTRMLRPAEFHPHLYKQFAGLAGDNESFRDFVSKFGAVTSNGHFQPVADIAATWLRLRTLISDWESGALGQSLNHLVANIVASIKPAGDGHGFKFVLAPLTLADAMFLQFGRAVCDGSALRSCEQCGNWFEIGAGGKRVTARFCSDNCRTIFHNARKYNPVAKAAPANRRKRS